MNIPIIDNIVMTSDGLNVTLNRRLVRKKGEHKCEEYLHAYAFYPNVVKALEKVLADKLMESDAESIKELICEHHELVRQFREILGTSLGDKK